MEDWQRDATLFRYSLIREAADPELSPRERGQVVRALAAREHVMPNGRRVRVGRSTIDRWIRDWRAGGYQGLIPDSRLGKPTTAEHILDQAVALKVEAPRRSAAHIAAMLAEMGWRVGARTLQRHFARLGLDRRGPAAPRAFARFEAEVPNELWVGDAMHARFRIAARPPVLFAYLDDHSRAITGWRWSFAEDTLRAEAALRSGLASRGVPRGLYLDNGSPFASRQLLRACAVLGIRLIHSKPGRPEGRGKIERFFRTVRDRFEIEVALVEAEDLAELNRLFGAWVEHDYHRWTHSETLEAPMARFLAHGAPAPPTPEQLREAFLWSEHRTVTKTATVSLHGNTFEVDAALVGRRVELVFDPFDLTSVEVRFEGRAMGTAVPHRVRRHSHPMARPEEAPVPPAPTGIDYLRLIAARHEEATRRRISYSALPDDQEDPA